MSTPLCLACASTLPEKALDSDSGSVFVTPCCRRPICERCVSKNPRLKEYDPCLACLTGVEVAKSRKESSWFDKKAYKTPETRDREREESQFVLGDEEEEDEGMPDHAHFQLREVVKEAEIVTEAWAGAADDLDAEREMTGQPKTPSRREPAPVKYWLKPKDTLQGIAMRYGVSARQICQLNSLHTSVLTTAPQLLHTRSFLILPPTSREPSPERREDIRKREEREKERAQKRFQFVTKEVDWRIARTYISLAEDDTDERARKAKEMPGRRSYQDASWNVPTHASSSAAEVQEGAVDQYLDDLEWEEQERRAGRGPRIQEFPFARPATNPKAAVPHEKRGGWFSRIRI